MGDLVLLADGVDSLGMSSAVRSFTTGTDLPRLQLATPFRYTSLSAPSIPLRFHRVRRRGASGRP